MTRHVPLSHESIDEFIREAAQRHEVSHQSWANFVTHTKFVLDDVPNLAPSSSGFLDFQIELWKKISGRSEYDAFKCEANENVNQEPSIQTTYPFISRNTQEIGSYLLGVANIVKKFPVPVVSRVVEFGVGYGHLTHILANSGFQVEAIDIEPRFLELLPKMAIPGAEPITCRAASFVDATFEAQSIDAFVFFECFHHCIEHARLLQNIRQALKPGGAIVFAAEAFYDDWFDFPWGLRTDGHSVWAIRKFGWMELGFRKSYMESSLETLGFSLEWSALPDAGAYGDLLIARLAS